MPIIDDAQSNGVANTAAAATIAGGWHSARNPIGLKNAIKCAYWCDVYKDREKEEGGGAVQWKSIVSKTSNQRHEQMNSFSWIKYVHR